MTPENFKGTACTEIYEGEYRRHYFKIEMRAEKTGEDVGEAVVKWVAGLHGEGTANSFEDALQQIESCFEKYFALERDRGYDRFEGRDE